MTTPVILLLVLVLLVGIIALLTFKITKSMRRLDVLYDYFIVSEKDADSLSRAIPPTNGKCPTREELEKLS